MTKNLDGIRMGRNLSDKRFIRLIGLAILSVIWQTGTLSSVHATVTSDQSIQIIREKIDALPRATSYAAREGMTLLEVRPAGYDEILYKSTDNGKTWKQIQRRKYYTETEDGLITERFTVEIYLDPKTGRLLRIFSEMINHRSGRMVDTGQKVRIYTQFSRDQGETWSPHAQLIQKGPEYDKDHYAQNTYFGRSSANPVGLGMLTLNDGTVILPYYFWPDTKYRETLPKNVGREADRWYMQSSCFRGTWRDDGKGLDWDSGGYMIVPTVGSPKGSTEPAIAILKNGSLLMITRCGGMYHDPKRGHHAVAHRAISNDGGRTWKNIHRMTYSDGSKLFTPASICALIRSKKNGKIYWIANIIEKPHYGAADPRHPLQIVEIDEETLGVKKETVTIIEDKSPDDPELVRFSNFKIYEERGTLDILLSLTVGYSELVKGSYPRPTYRYRIKLPAATP